MNKIKHKIPIILLLVTVLGIAGISAIAQLNDVGKQDNFDDNQNLARIFRLINSLNSEADKQQEKGFTKRAEAMRSYFQKKTGISDETKTKLNELATKFQKESSDINAKFKEIKENQKDNPEDESFKSEIKKLQESRNNLYESSRKSLNENVAKEDVEKMLKFLRENVIEKIQNNKTKIRKNLKDKINPNWFKTISYDDDFVSFIEGYSFVEYDAVNNEVWSGSITQGTCDNVDLDHDDRDYDCSAAYVYSTLSDPDTGIATDTLATVGSNAEVYLYGTPIMNGQYCVDAFHAIEDNQYNTLDSQSSDCVNIELPTPNAEISSVVYEEINSAIDTNPGNGQPNTNVGYRIFPDKTGSTDTTNRATVTIQATVSPAVENVEIHFKTFDLDDPSSNTLPIDDETEAQDNRGLVKGKKEGEFTGGANTAFARTDNNGVATVTLTVTKQPGDNFAVAVSKDPTYLSNIVVDGVNLKNGSQTISTSGVTSTSTLAIRTEMLTVWRKLYIEVDSMGNVTGNKVSGSFSANYTIDAGATKTLFLTSLTPNFPLESNRFENGRIVVDTGGGNTRSFRVKYAEVTEPANTSSSVTIVNDSSAFNITAGQSFTLYDDDDMNDNDGVNLDGDDGEDVSAPSMGLLPNASDTIAANIFLPAFVRTIRVPSSSDISDNSIFKANIDTLFSTDIRPLFVDYDLALGPDIDPKGTDDDFWTVFILGAYQPTLFTDLDPNTKIDGDPAEGTLGIADQITGVTGDKEGSGALIFMELQRSKEYPNFSVIATDKNSVAATVAHEIGHLFSSEHGDGEIMGTSNGVPLSTKFSNITLHKIRGLKHP